MEIDCWIHAETSTRPIHCIGYPFIMRHQPLPILPFLILCCILAACKKAEEKEASVPIQETAEVATEPSLRTNSSLLDANERKIPDKSTKYTYTPPEDDSIIIFGGFKTLKPTNWIWMPKNSASLLCKYAIESDSKDNTAFFTARQLEGKEVGDIQFHIQRWTSQFHTEDGRPIKPKLKIIPLRGKNATHISISGEYRGESGTMHQEQRSMVIVIFEEEDSTYFLKIFGQKNVVQDSDSDLLFVLKNLELLPETE
jgi:hypothetical protein